MGGGLLSKATYCEEGRDGGAENLERLLEKRRIDLNGIADLGGSGKNEDGSQKPAGPQHELGRRHTGSERKVFARSKTFACYYAARRDPF